MLSHLPYQMLNAQQVEHSHRFQLPNSCPIREIRQNDFKIVLLGESGVGKSALALRFDRDQFSENLEATIAGAYFEHTIWFENADGQSAKIKLEIWDTAGQERYRSITPMYIREAKAAIVVYDISDQNSFVKAKDWVERLRNAQVTGFDNANVQIAFVGNKVDLDERREVELEEAQKYAIQNRLIFIETSAKTSMNVCKLFKTLSEVLFRKELEREDEEGASAKTNNDEGKNAKEIRGIMLDKIATFQEETREKVQNCCNVN